MVPQRRIHTRSTSVNAHSHVTPNTSANTREWRGEVGGGRGRGGRRGGGGGRRGGGVIVPAVNETCQGRGTEQGQEEDRDAFGLAGVCLCCCVYVSYHASQNLKNTAHNYSQTHTHTLTLTHTHTQTHKHIHTHTHTRTQRGSCRRK